MQAVQQVTVVEYVSEFFRKFNVRAYGKSSAANAKAGAEALMGMLKLVLSKGGRDELRTALHCFKDQLAVAANSSPAVRSQMIDDLYALLSALVDAAERLRQFSPVKESLSGAVLEELRWRLFRILAGDGFADDVELRRRALDLVFAASMREQAALQQSLSRQSRLAAGGGGCASASAAAAASAAPQAAAGRLRAGLGRGKGPLTGPDVSSWEGLWCSLSSMPGKRMLPLMQSVMADLYMGKLVPGSPAAAAAAAAAATAHPVSSSSSSSTQQAKQQQQQVAGGASAPQPQAAAAAAAAADDGGSDIAIRTPPLRSSEGEEAQQEQQQQQLAAVPAQQVSAHVMPAAAPPNDGAAAAAAGNTGGSSGSNGSGSSWLPKSWVAFHKSPSSPRNSSTGPGSSSAAGAAAASAAGAAAPGAAVPGQSHGSAPAAAAAAAATSGITGSLGCSYFGDDADWSGGGAAPGGCSVLASSGGGRQGGAVTASVTLPAAGAAGALKAVL